MFKNLIGARATAGLLAIVIAAGMVAGCGGENDTASSDTAGDPPRAAAVVQNSDESLSFDSNSPGAAPLPSSIDRKITRTATLELSVKDIGKSVQSIEDIATAAGGFVSGSRIFVQEPDDGSAVTREKSQAGTVTIRVPSDAYAGVMSQLRGIADEVVSETSDASEVTEEYTDLQARRRNLEATEASYLKLLAQAATIPDILTVQDRLNSVRGEIEQVQGRINVLDDLTALATITVQMNQPPVAVEEAAEKGWVKEAWETSLDVAEGAMIVGVTVGIFAGVSLLWLLPLLLIALIIWKLFGRRIAVGVHRMLSVN